MTEPVLFPVGQLAEFPATRALGREGRGRLEDLLDSQHHVDVTIDFGSVEAMTISFADEFLAKFLSTFDAVGHDATVKLTGLNTENLEAVSICLERRGTPAVVLNAEGALGLVGEDDVLRHTFEVALSLRTFKAADIAQAMSVTPQNANNRLKRLAEVGALRKSRAAGSARGGKEFAYQAVTADVPDAEELLTV